MSDFYDIAVIGGGIQGAGIAQAAAASGYSTLIIEKNDWGAGTSSKSSKLVHGGLRYLQSGQINLVRECLREREILLKIAPDLVHRKPFYIPLFENSKASPAKVRAGLSLYWILSGCKSVCRYNNLMYQQPPGLEQLNTSGMTHLFRYTDAQTDDLLLTHAVIQSAKSYGAVAKSRCELISAAKTKQGYALKMQRGSQEILSQCRFLINAAGPWAPQLQHKITEQIPFDEFDLVQGTHLLFDRQITPHCLYLEAPQDHRAIFILPWRQGSLVGTTELIFDEQPEQCAPTQMEISYLMTALRHHFPDWQEEPRSAFAGLRVLSKETRMLPFNRSREVKILQNRNSITVFGGKLTTYRSTAIKVLKRASKAMEDKRKIADTSLITLQHPGQIDLTSQPANDDIAPAAGQNSVE